MVVSFVLYGCYALGVGLSIATGLLFAAVLRNDDPQLLCPWGRAIDSDGLDLRADDVAVRCYALGVGLSIATTKPDRTSLPT